MADARDHDGSYKLLFSHVQMVEDLLREFTDVPWVDQVDFSQAETMATDFVSGWLDHRESDLIWRLPLRSGGEIYVSVLIEFQSTPQPWMALRMLVYVALFYQHLVRTQGLKPAQGLPPVFPMVVYNGSDAFAGPTSMGELINVSEGSMLWQWQPSLRYHLIDEHALNAEVLRDAKSLVARLFEMERSDSFGEVATIMEQVVGVLKHQSLQSLRSAFRAWAIENTKRHDGVSWGEDAPEGLEEFVSMLREKANKWWKQLDDAQEAARQAQEAARHAQANAEAEAKARADAQTKAAEAQIKARAEAEARIEAHELAQAKQARQSLTELYTQRFEASPNDQISAAIHGLSASRAIALVVDVAMKPQTEVDALLLATVKN